MFLSIFSAVPLTAQMKMPACHPMPPSADPGPPSQLPEPRAMKGVGNVHFPISAAKPETQQWFDQGINLLFDFWDYESSRAFEQAIRTDPGCAICHWGLSQSLSFRNDEARGYAHDELMKAAELRSHASDREKLYIDIAQAEEAEHLSGKEGGKDKDAEPKSTTLLRQLVKENPRDTTAKIMLSEAVREGYDDDGKPRSGTQESMSLLQEVLRIEPSNSAANHLWIHAVEAGPHPEQALHSADILASLAPASGHMVHMPGHIYYRTGDYIRAQKSFDDAEAVDEAYLRDQKIPVDADWNYVHNLMYSIANLMESGRMRQAAALSAKLTDARGHREDTLYPFSPRDSAARLNPLLPVALRTGNWEQVEALLSTADAPDSLPNLKFLGASLYIFAQGMQKASAKELDQAGALSTSLDAALWRMQQQADDADAAQKAEAAQKKDAPAPKPENHDMSPDPLIHPLLKNLAIMSIELRAAILVAGDHISEGEKLFAEARQEEKALGYREPPASVRPVAEEEASALMTAGRNSEAAAAWKHVLEERPRSGFAYYGLAVAAEAQGDAKTTTENFRQLLDVWSSADSDLPQLVRAHDWIDRHQERDAEARPAN